jgi:hypothetical protein
MFSRTGNTRRSNHSIFFPQHYGSPVNDAMEESEKNRGRWLMLCQINKIRTSPAISFPVYDLGHRRYFGNLTIANARAGCSNVNLPRFFSLSHLWRSWSHW